MKSDSLNAELWSSATMMSAWLPDFRHLVEILSIEIRRTALLLVQIIEVVKGLPRHKGSVL